jgi:ketosteroid isomerase-like protein
MDRNIATTLAILRDEIRGDVEAALLKMDPDYSMTWVYQGRNGKLFPRVGASVIRKSLKEVYVIKGRRYDIKNIATGDGIVMVELVESYPDPKTKKVYRTPEVIVLEFKRGKIHRGRHYCDPRLSYMFLTPQQIRKAFK